MTGVITDAKGNFTLANITENATLVFSFVSMKTQEVKLEGKNTINVKMEEESFAIEEVVAVGYGTQSRSKITTSVAKLDNKVLENISYTNAALALQGNISGLTVQSTSGQPGTTPIVVLRGGTSIDNPDGSTPLYIVDGVYRNDMNNINTQEIESVQVMKDAASTAIYGSRGSNGVIIVVTKSGKAGAFHVNYNYDLTISKRTKETKILSARDFIYFGRLGIARNTTDAVSLRQGLGSTASFGTGNDLTNQTAFNCMLLTPLNQYLLNEPPDEFGSVWETMQDPIYSDQTIIFKGFDYRDVLFRTGISNNHNLSVSGGTEKARFSLGIGRLDDQGIAIRSSYNRTSINLNGDVNASNNLSFFGRVMYSNTSTKGFSSERNLFQRVGAPTTKYKFEDGTLAPGQAISIGNPAYIIDSQNNKNEFDDFTIIAGAKWQIIPGLTFDPQISLYKTISNVRTFQKAYLNGPRQYVDTRTATGSSTTKIQQQADAVITYKKSFKTDHNFEFKAGLTFVGTENDALSATGRGAASDLIPTLNASATPVSVSSTESHQIIMGYFSRINYDFKQKYLVTANVRYDGASNLGDNSKWGFFPGISLGWNVDEEDFWRLRLFPGDLLKLKLRASYGVNGNISGIGPYTAQGQYSVGYRYYGNAAIINTVMSNQDLQWERSKTYDVGMDIGVFDRRINFMFDYYRRVTDNLLTSMSLPYSAGFSSTMTNLGSLENKGVEIEMGARVLPKTSDFCWDISFNFAKVANKILKLPDNGVKNNRIGGIYIWDAKLGDYTWEGGLQEGGRMGELFAYKQVSIYATDEEAAGAPVDQILAIKDKTKFGGDVNWLDADKNGIIDTRDQVYMGNIYPKWTGGFTNSFGYKGITLSIRTDFITGHTIYNYTRALLLENLQGENALHIDVLRSWQKQGDITDIPIYTYNDMYRLNVKRGNSQFYEKGNFLALREITLSYDVPKSVLKKAKINSLRFNITGNNLYYFTKYKGTNPEQGGTDNGRYPLPMSIIFGAKVDF